MFICNAHLQADTLPGLLLLQRPLPRCLLLGESVQLREPGRLPQLLPLCCGQQPVEAPDPSVHGRPCEGMDFQIQQIQAHRGRRAEETQHLDVDAGVVTDAHVLWAGDGGTLSLLAEVARGVVAMLIAGAKLSLGTELASGDARCSVPSAERESAVSAMRAAAAVGNTAGNARSSMLRNQRNSFVQFHNARVEDAVFSTNSVLVR